jgi:glycosyltransferase involved in cell wall biosynthesis
MPLLYDRADVFVNSSVVDNQPLSVLEAFAAGVPIVTTSTGGIAGMVREGETGLIVAPDDPAAMAQAVERLLSRPDQARQMTRRAHDELGQYTWASTRQRWSNVYRAVAA